MTTDNTIWILPSMQITLMAAIAIDIQCIDISFNTKHVTVLKINVLHQQHFEKIGVLMKNIGYEHQI